MKRTNVEIRPEHIAKLREIAAKRGERGYARILAEAIESFIATQALEQERRRRAVAMAGALSDKEADRILDRIRKGRHRPWRS